MIDPLLSGAIIFSSLLTLLSIGLTLTYLTTKVPNFAHGAFAAVGAYVSLTGVSVWGGSPYQFLFVAFITGGLIGLAQYLIVFRPLIRKRATIVGLMIATLAIEFILLAGMNIYADFLSRQFKIRSRYFLLSIHDVDIGGLKGLLVASPTLAVATVTMLYLALTKTKFGVAMRASIEDPSLASVVSINVNMVYAVSWFIAGGLGCLAGALLPLWFPGNPDMGSKVIVSVFAASIVGGLGSIYGAVVGGFLIGLAELLGTRFLAIELGAWVIPYRPLIPLIAIAVTLLVASEGLLGIEWFGTAKGIRGKIAGFLRSPTETFSKTKDEGWVRSIRYFLELLLIFAFLQTVIFVGIPEYYAMVLSLSQALIPLALFVQWPPILGFILILAIGLISMLGISLLTHLWTRVVSDKKNGQHTVKAIADGSTPLLLLGWIPFVGIAFAAWSIVLAAVGIKQLHQLSSGKAAVATVAGVVCFCVLAAAPLLLL